MELFRIGKSPMGEKSLYLIIEILLFFLNMKSIEVKGHFFDSFFQPLVEKTWQTTLLPIKYALDIPISKERS